MKGIELRFAMTTYSATVNLSQLYAPPSTFSIAHNIAADTQAAFESGHEAVLQKVACSLFEGEHDFYQFKLCLTFDWPHEPNAALKAIGMACVNQGCESFEVQDSLDAGLPPVNKSPYAIKSSDLSIALQRIRANTKQFEQAATEGRGYYILNYNASYLV